MVSDNSRLQIWSTILLSCRYGLGHKKRGRYEPCLPLIEDMPNDDVAEIDWPAKD
jgi:hypothetical protein